MVSHQSLAVLAVILGFCLFIFLLSKEEDLADIELDMFDDDDDDDDGPNPTASAPAVA